MKSNPHPQRHRWIMGLFFIVIFGPALFAWILVQKNEQVSMKLQHHGDLIKPMPKIQSFNEIESAPYLGKWLLLMVAPQECDSQQSEKIHLLQQLQIALGKDAQRVQQAVVALSPASQSSCQSLVDPIPGLAILALSEKSFESQLGAYSHTTKRQAQGELFIVDPQGNILMHYDASVPASDVLKDLKRLLRVSKIG